MSLPPSTILPVAWFESQFHVPLTVKPQSNSQPIDPMKNPGPAKSLTPSLFHIAANIDDSPASSHRRPLSSCLPSEDWPFSRDSLERALQARMSEIRHHHLPADRQPKPTRKAVNHLFEIADAGAKAE
jgi:hypothetical protein